MYAYVIGQCGISPEQYNKMTEAETMGIIAGHQIEKSEDAANFRNLFVAMVKLWGKEKRTAEQIWPLPTDAADKFGGDDKKRFSFYDKILENSKMGVC